MTNTEKLRKEAENYANDNAASDGELYDEGCLGFYFGIMYAADKLEEWEGAET